MAEKKPVSRPNLLLDSLEPMLIKNATQESPQHNRNNTMEAQTQPTDPKVPRNTPQLVGLTTFTYDPETIDCKSVAQPKKSLLMASDLAQNFYQDKPKSKRVTKMRKHAANFSAASQFIELSIHLPYEILLEQVNLIVSSKSKTESLFSRKFKLCEIRQEESDICVKSCFSESVTKSGKIEYNVVAVTRTVKLIFAKDPAVVDVEDIEIKLQQIEDIQLEDRLLDRVHKGETIQSIINDDDDDLRILDSIPNSLGKSKEKKQVAEFQDTQFSKMLLQIELVGFNMNTIPAITNLTYFMNQAFFFQNKKRYAEANKVDFMVGQLLVTTKRAIQAAEVYRKMQMKILQDQVTPHQLVECAVYELLISDSLSSEHQLNEKMASQQRMAQMIRGIQPKLIDLRFAPHIKVPEFDSFSSMLNILPDCLRFSIVCLSHKYEIVKISALKLLKYILETQGCSLDIGLVFILKGILKTYPQVSKLANQQDFDLSSLLGKDISITEYLFKKSEPVVSFVQATKCQTKNEPTSGFKRALLNIYQHVLDTFISVLSSVSSHILHNIFYEVIEPTFLSIECPLEVKIFTCKIAEKIITICQGDLLLSNPLLDAMINYSCGQKIQQLPDSLDATATMQIKNLWFSIRQKVFPNYSQRGFRNLVGWLVGHLSDVKESTQNLEELVRNLAEVITIVAIGRQKGEEDANQLIRLPTNDKFGGGSSSELYLVLTPLIYWLEFSIDKEDRLPMFQQLYQTIKDVLEGLTPGHCELDITSIMIPSLQRTNEFLAENSPSLSMLKFLDIVLSDMQKHYAVKGQRPYPPQDMQYFFLDMLSNFVACLSYSLYEEVFLVFDKLLSLCADNITDRVLKKCIVALVDKYTMKSKQHKTTLSTFLKCLLDLNVKKKPQSPTSREINLDALSDGGADTSMQRSSYFEIMAEFCFFTSFEELKQENLRQLHFRGPLDMHDLYIDKLQFFIDSIGQMNEMHINLFTNLITHPNFKTVLMNLLLHGETSVRLKSHEILEALTAYFVQFCPSKTVYEFASGQNPTQNEMMDAEFISHERLYISQIVIQVSKSSLERTNDCYLQFNALILLDFLFQNLLPVPTFHNEQLKQKRVKQETEEGLQGDDHLTMDVELLSISENTPELDVMDPVYLRMRMKLVMSLWPHVQLALNSPWSNIRSICYGLICSMLKIDVNDYPQDLEYGSFDSKNNQLNQSDMLNDRACQARLQQCVLPMLYSLLSSKESESKAGGLNILGSFCGLSYDFSGVNIHKNVAFFQRNSKFVSLPIWRLVFLLQDDWDITIKEASVVLVQLCAPRNAILYFHSLKEKSEKQRLDYMLTKMPKASDIYLSTQKMTQNLGNCPIKSEHAQRALQLFPSAKDRDEVLNCSMEEPIQTLISLETFMMNHNAEFPIHVMSCHQIEAENQSLAEVIHTFNPNYEDKRLTKPHQPMSRRRQIEIELNMGRGKGAVPEEETDPNFFVDKYSDSQIQEIISIFRNDFKPPKNLWIEKQPSAIGAVSSGGPQNQSPDFFQDIYSEAIEQFNQHQMVMQQKQQDELQQQVSSGISSASSNNTSFASPEKNEIVRSNSPASVESSNSDTPPPSKNEQVTQEVKISDQPVREKIQPTVEVPSNKLTVPIGPVGPTSPVLVSQCTSNILGSKSSKPLNQKPFIPEIQSQKLEISKPQKPLVPVKPKEPEIQPQKLQVEQIKFDPQVPVKNREEVKPPKLSENDYFNESDPHLVHLKIQTQKVTKDSRASEKFTSYSSQPELLTSNISKGNYQVSPKQKRSIIEGSTVNSEENRISRKMAQTYLSGLSQGYLQNLDSLKLINNCLNQHSQELQPNQKQTNSLVGAKLSIKTSAILDNQLMGSLTYQSTKSQKNKKSTISNSPKDSKDEKKRKVSNKLDLKKSFQHHKSNLKKNPVNNLADLNYFIKTIEKDLCEKFQSMQDISSMPNTPSNMMKKVGDQMKALGVDPKLWKQVEQQEITRKAGARDPPYVKLLALNQLGKISDDASNMTPSNSGQVAVNRMNKTNSPTRPNPRQKSEPGSEQFCKTQRMDKKENILQIATIGDRLKTFRETSGGYTYDTNDKLSSGRGVSSNSGTKSNNLVNQPAILTERSEQRGTKFQATSGKSSKHQQIDSAGFFAMKKGSSKSQQKGYSALATKGVFSPQMKRDPQSGGLIPSKFSVQNNQISFKNKNLTKVNYSTKNANEFLQEIMNVQGKMPQSNRNMEQGDRKTLSPDSNKVGKPPLKKKAGLSDASNGHLVPQGHDGKGKSKMKN